MVNVRKSSDGEKVSIAFEFTWRDIIDSGMSGDFITTWHSKRPRDFANFVTNLMRALVEGRQTAKKDPFTKAYEEVMGRQSSGASRSAQEKFQGFNFNAQRVYWDEAAGLQEPAWCKVLGLRETATKDEIKAKYRQLAKTHHPDRGGNATKFDEITNAYQEAMK